MHSACREGRGLMSLIHRFEDWGVDHLDYIVALAVVLSLVSLMLAIVVAVR